MFSSKPSIFKKFTIFVSAYGVGNYEQESAKKFKATMENSDQSIKKSEEALKRGDHLLRKANDLLRKIR